MNPNHLLIAALLAIVSLVASDNSGQPISGGLGEFTSYKLSLNWPPTVCLQPETDCKSKVLNSFKILGFWPFYLNGDIVPPYNPDTNRCSKNPIQPDDIMQDLKTLHERLTTDWPDVRDYTNKEANEEMWKSQWSRHGMCSEYPDDPYMYFQSALVLYTLHNNPFNGTGIEPRSAPYKAKWLSEGIKYNLGVYPEIACDKINGDLALKEIRICVRRDKGITPPIHELQDCPSKYAYNCHSDDDDVRYVNYPLLKN